MKKRLAAAIVMCLAATACTRHRPLRSAKDEAPAPAIATSPDRLERDSAHRTAVGQASIERHAGFTLAVIELDDQGQLWSRKQYDQVIGDLRRVYDRSPAGVQAVVFVHGWKHSSGVCDSNVACFRELLRGFAQREGEDGRPVYGVYVAWRGLSVKPPLLKELTFWSRKRTAHRVGAGDAIEVLGTLEALHRRKRSEEGGRATRLSIIGHSFGAAVVYSAIAGTLKERLAAFIQARGDTPAQFVGFGTITLLVNPAFEATLYEGIDAMLRLNPASFDARNPRVLVTVASDGDAATRFAFPVGRFLGTLFQRSRGDGQRGRMLTTVGNYAPFRTHRLEPAARQAASPVASTACGCPSGIAAAFARDTDYDPGTFSADEDVEVLGRTQLRKVASGPQASSPFLVTRASSEVIGDHNDIWTPAFADFMAALILRTDALLAR